MPSGPQEKEYLASTHFYHLEKPAITLRLVLHRRSNVFVANRRTSLKIFVAAGRKFLLGLLFGEMFRFYILPFSPEQRFHLFR